jgi:hypothetical protein
MIATRKMKPPTTGWLCRRPIPDPAPKARNRAGVGWVRSARDDASPSWSASNASGAKQALGVPSRPPPASCSCSARAPQLLLDPRRTVPASELGEDRRYHHVELVLPESARRDGPRVRNDNDPSGSSSAGHMSAFGVVSLLRRDELKAHFPLLAKKAAAFRRKSRSIVTVRNSRPPASPRLAPHSSGARSDPSSRRYPPSVPTHALPSRSDPIPWRAARCSCRWSEPA